MSVLKLCISLGSQKKYIFIQSSFPTKRELIVFDLKMEILRNFHIPFENQFNSFRDNNLHDYLDNTPLAIFGLENDSILNVWSKEETFSSKQRLFGNSQAKVAPYVKK